MGENQNEKAPNAEGKKDGEEQPAPEVVAANSPKAAEAPKVEAAGESNPDEDKPE